MSNDKQAEAWRDEFAKAIGHNYTVRSDGRYVDVQIDNVWQGFLMAKRSMQPIELPDSDDYFDKFETNIYGYESAVHEAITAAGYSYRVRE